MIEEFIYGYIIVRSVEFDNGGGFALGMCKSAPFPWATWYFKNNNGEKSFYGGRYFTRENADLAGLDFVDRFEKYKNDNPHIAVMRSYRNTNMGI